MRLPIVLLLGCTLASAHGQAGTLDATFGNGGMVLGAAQGVSGAVDMVLAGDGSIYVLANYYEETNAARILLFKFDQNGNPDGSFGTPVTTTASDSLEIASAMALQADGKILVAGTSKDFPGENHTSRALLRRFNPDGSPDAGFGNGGRITHQYLGAPSMANDLVVQADGSILALGQRTVSGAAWVLWRYTPNGALEAPSFGSVFGTVVYDGIGSELALRPDGRIMVAGQENDDYFLVSYTSDGSIDLSFLPFDGTVVLDAGYDIDEPVKILTRSDGMIVVVRTPYYSGGFALASIMPNGSLDPGFGSGGTLLAPPLMPWFEQPVDAVNHPGSKFLLLCNQLGGPFGSSARGMVLHRYLQDGSLDTSFDGDGTMTQFDDPGIFVDALELQSDGKILVCGWDGNPGVTLLRFLNDVDHGNDEPGIDTGPLSIAPNPFQDLLLVQGARPGAVIALYDLTGRVVVDGLVLHTSFVLEPGELAHGTYVLREQLDNDVRSTLVVKYSR
jgi:uncharacterized delta-60 repeat protein